MTNNDKTGRKSGSRGQGKPEMRSRGFKDRPGHARGGRAGGKPGKPHAGGSRGYKDRPPPSSVPVRSRPQAEPAPAEEPQQPSERIAKRLARAGVASRREAEAMIAAGRITLNGQKLDSPAVNVTADDKIAIDGHPIPEKERTRLWLFHKPAGLVTTTRDDEGRTTVFERLPKDLPRVVTVGRLDINTEGLLLLTNDGGLARTLELPQTGWLRRYRVRAHGRVNQKRLDSLKDGIAVDGVFYGGIDARLEREQGANMWIEIGLREGKNREVKNVLGALGLEVNRLIRISFGPFQLGGLEPGETMEVKGKTLRDQLGARLIAESGADFDAPIRNVFPNRPVKAQVEDAPPPMTAEKSGDWVSGTHSPMAAAKAAAKGAAGRQDRPGRQDRSGRQDRPGHHDKAGRDAKPGRSDKTHRHEKAGDRRERLRDQWSTHKDGDEDAKSKPKGRSNRSSNVWMAPGARPAGGKRRRSDGASGKPAARKPGPRKPGPRKA